MSKKTTLLFCVILFLASAIQSAQTGNLQITLNINEEYDLGEAVYICGNLTSSGSPVTDGFVTIQIDDPKDDVFVLRTLNTGDTPSGPWAVEIIEFITCDSSGNPQSNFEAGGNLGIKINVKNNAANTQHVIVTANLYDSDAIPFIVFKLYEKDMDPETNTTRTIWPIPIPDDAKHGQAFAYASVFNEWPKNGGFAFSPEKLTLFNIGSGGSGNYGTQEINSASVAGEFNLTFHTNPYGGLIGNYNFSVTSYYQWWFASNQTTFDVYILGDVNGDGKVRVDDILAVAVAFGSNEGEPGWDPRCDLTGDGKVRVDDVLIAATAFGKYCGNPPEP